MCKECEQRLKREKRKRFLITVCVFGYSMTMKYIIMGILTQ